MVAANMSNAGQQSTSDRFIDGISSFFLGGGGVGKRRKQIQSVSTKQETKQKALTPPPHT